MNNIEIVQFQLNECLKRGVPYLESPYYLMVGLSRDFDLSIKPINGLRHPPEGVTTGWYIWSGENFSTETDFFEPVHCLYLIESCPEIARYLGLPPGWRFLYADGFEDVWNDESLFEIEPSSSSNMFDYFKQHKNEFLGKPDEVH
jgi:hypothetical protein